ncbi:MAG: 23S rRNA (adenine(2503)-C(2))-methyltransferase RlmN [Gammaproteobacteria bacterium]|nr:23S rRNA (adenine(2503)-C(2))-methyltransferase RlmN [Gammaproteobacteria bacterium]
MKTNKNNLIGMPLDDLVSFFQSIGEKKYRAKQLMDWLYRRSIFDFNSMTDLNKDLRKYLNQNYCLHIPMATKKEKSSDGTIKWIIGLGESQAIEAVYIPEKSRGTLCVSSQIGCLIDCPFCATGHQGFNRNLSSAEIIGQVLLAKQDLKNKYKRDDLITNIVFMGMGEPLANFSETVRATKILTDPNGFNISRRRVTISTSGLVPQILKLGDHLNVSLAISLHAPFDDLRDELVPINRVHPIESLLDACWFYAKKQNLKNITFEYTLLKDVNDLPEHANQLAKLLRSQPAKVNLIPFNKFPGVLYDPTPADHIDEFRNILLKSGIMTLTRRTRGSDIQAACGQLSGTVNNLAKKSLRQKLKKTLN